MDVIRTPSTTAAKIIHTFCHPTNAAGGSTGGRSSGEK